ncbi:unnamed protein product [Symbiodinium necroappetens]|uniref:Uncharacterized protein n=1 Tax=Symbiodinium necroappetens TaxID=1628268 RepID=A0A812RZ02_9DINO|nr:unnamed protein product [Symbiodinium necroappetens]
MASEAGVSPDKFQVTSIGFETVVGISLSDAVTLEEVTSALSAITGVNASQISVPALQTGQSGARRLQASALECVIKAASADDAALMSEVLAEASSVEQAFLSQGLNLTASITDPPRIAVKISQQVTAEQGTVTVPSSESSSSLLRDVFQTEIEMNILDLTFMASSSSTSFTSSLTTSSSTVTSELESSVTSTSSVTSSVGMTTITTRSATSTVTLDAGSESMYAFDVELWIADASAFNSTAYVIAMASEAGVSPDKFQVTSIGFETVVGISLSDAVTLEEVTSALSAITGVNASQISVPALQTGQSGARRLQASALECVIKAASADDAALMSEVLSEASSVEQAFLSQGLNLTASITDPPRIAVKISQQVTAEQGTVTVPSSESSSSLLRDVFQTEIEMNILDVTFMASSSSTSFTSSLTTSSSTVTSDPQSSATESPQDPQHVLSTGAVIALVLSMLVIATTGFLLLRRLRRRFRSDFVRQTSPQELSIIPMPAAAGEPEVEEHQPPTPRTAWT